MKIELHFMLHISAFMLAVLPAATALRALSLAALFLPVRFDFALVLLFVGTQKRLLPHSGAIG